MRFGQTGARPDTLDELGRGSTSAASGSREIERETLKRLESLPEAQRIRDAI